MSTRPARERMSEYRERLLSKRQQLEAEVGKTSLYGRDQEDDSTKDLGDQAANAYEREFQFELGSGDRRLLRDVLDALRKLDDGRFGVCERCANPIGDKRLEALPFARYCIDCQRRSEADERAEVG